jgi:hypothetical protein
MDEILTIYPSFQQMDDYPYATLRANGWLRCDGLHRPSFPTLLRDVLHRFGYMGTPMYHGHLYREFGHGHCEVHVDILTHPSDPSLMAWFMMTTGDDLDDTLERAAHQALTEFCERHLPGLDSTVVALLPVRVVGNPVWSEWLATACDPTRPTYHAGWAFTVCYAQHVSSMLQEVTAISAHQHLRIEEYDHQVEAKHRLIADARTGKRELLQQNHILEMRSNELMRTYRTRDFKTDALDSTWT